MSQLVGVIRPDSGNITSMGDCLQRLGVGYRLLATPESLADITTLLLPGQGRFGALMRYLDRTGWTPVLQQWCAEDKPFVGICVGMQVLFAGSEEDEGAGLGVLPGRVQRMRSPKHPMIGWSEIDWLQAGYPAGAAYFVNSYAVYESADVLARATYGEPFVAAVKRGNLSAFQFHPEKSGKWGQELLSLCLDY